MIRVERNGAVATVLLDRPQARNAISGEGWRSLTRCFTELAASDESVVVLRSAVPGIFSAGADLTELARLADHPAERAPFRETMRAAIDALAALPMPSIAAVEGGCFGAAVAVALAADLRVASEGATFAVPPAKLGIGYPAEDVARLAARVGQGQAANLLFTAAPIDASEARRIGLVDLSANADEVAATIAANDADSIRLLKAFLTPPLDPAHGAAFDASFGSPAFRRETKRFRR